MKPDRFFFILIAMVLTTLSSCDSQKPPAVSMDRPPSSAFRFSSPSPEHQHMRLLVENAFAYLDPKHGLIDSESGYPLEGWNQDPERGLFLRSFSQITAIGEWIELLALISAGHADNPYLSREEARAQLQKTIATLRTDQADPGLGANGLLVNFIGLENGRRMGPLAQSVLRQDFVDQFGQKEADALWQALIEKEWLKPQNNDTEGLVLRSETFGSDYFDGPLERWADETSIRRVMDILDDRVVLVAYGDNANLTASVAKAIGALLHDSVKGLPEMGELREGMEAFLEAQEEGYRDLVDEAAGMFSFGRDEKTGRFFGWNNRQGEWVVGHQDYFVNEFRDPTMFLLTRFDLPIELLGNLGFKMKSYQTAAGKLHFTLAPFTGASFQVFGLDLAMPHLEHPSWRAILENAVVIEIDYASRHRHPGFLSESYSGDGTEYTGEVGMPDLAVAQEGRITTAPSLYTLGTAYQIAPDEVAAFVKANWSTIETLLTEHGPWEGFQSKSGTPIEFQTTAHTLSLILGALGQGPENMRRYLEWKGLTEKLDRLYESGPARDLLDPSVEVTQWAADGAAIEVERKDGSLEIRSESKTTAGIILKFPPERLADLSGGTLDIRYRSARSIPRVVIVPKRVQSPGPGVIQSEIITRFPSITESKGELSVPLPSTPGLRDVAVIEINFDPAQGAEVTEFRIDALGVVSEPK